MVRSFGAPFSRVANSKTSDFFKKQREKKEKELAEQQQQEAGEDVVLEAGTVQGVESTEGTGYTSFSDLLKAKTKKVEDIKGRTITRKAGNFASLLGGDDRLG